MSDDNHAALFATIRKALAEAEFRTNTAMRNRVAARISTTYRGTGVVAPKLDDVIDEALADVCADLRAQANELEECGKVDSCSAKAVVLSRLAEFLAVAS